ncbi:MAG: tyrosine-type recombinase/integrase [Variovorax sp.]|nr:tyrosine-type recombinase/integrase [Variovorax sp.]
MSALNLRTETARAKLVPRATPYFTPIETGCSLGFRRIAGSATGGTWTARRYEPSAKSSYLYKTLGEFAHLPAGERHDAALAAARKWFNALPVAGLIGEHTPMADGVRTLRDACMAYVEKCRRERVTGKPDHGEKKAADHLRRYQQYVFDVPAFADTKLEDLQPRQFIAWRERLANLPTKSGPNTGGTRSEASLGRDLTPVRAALRYAHELGYVTSDAAWRVPLKPPKDTGGRREVVLTRAERVALIKGLPRELALLIECMCLLPLRVGAIAALTVGDLQGSTLRIGVDKANADRRTQLPPAALDLLTRMAKDRPAKAPMFPRRDGKQFQKEDWKDEVKAAALAADLPAATVATSIRHSVITELVSAGTPILTVAQLAGTSVRMIEKHYGHLQDRGALAALKLLELPGVKRRVKTATESTRRTKRARVSATNRVKAMLAEREAQAAIEAA